MTWIMNQTDQANQVNSVNPLKEDRMQDTRSSVRNTVQLLGTVREEAEFSHENHGVRFFRFFLEVPRLSGQTDILPVMIPESKLPVQAGEEIQIYGQLRSFNNRSGIGNRLVLTVYAQILEHLEHMIKNETRVPCNRIQLTGALCRPPVFRRTPLGRSICDLMLAVPRRYRRADYLPVIAWGQLAAKVSRLQVGDMISLEGRVQSRLYQKVTDRGVEERTAYEVSMMQLLDD